MRPDSFKLSDGQKVICRYGTRSEHKYSSRLMDKNFHIDRYSQYNRGSVYEYKDSLNLLRLVIFNIPYRPKPI